MSTNADQKGSFDVTSIFNIFQMFDQDNNGYISDNDFVLAAKNLGLGSIGDEVIKREFKKVDKNGNGKLEFNEALGCINIIKAALDEKLKRIGL